MLLTPQLDEQSQTPLYRQLYSHIRGLIDKGLLADGTKLPPTRELSETLGINRATVASAYRLLEEEGLLRGHVGRGSYINAPSQPSEPIGVTAPAVEAAISFTTARPSEELFPVEEFRQCAREVLDHADLASILQLGSPLGFAPLRDHLREELRRTGALQSSDDVMITSGCQQALDLVRRTLIAPGELAVVEEPVYPGLREIFHRAGIRLAGIRMTTGGIDLQQLQVQLRRERARLLVVTPDFQNPTGCTMPFDQRQRLLDIAAQAGVTIIEISAYSALRYHGEPVPSLKELDRGHRVIQLGSYSKIAFPGLRIGWIVAARDAIEKLSEAKHWTDLHSEQLSQAVLLRFSESGRLEAHRRRVITAGRERLVVTLEALRRQMPQGTTHTEPVGGMNVWVRLPGLDSADLLHHAVEHGVSFLPGRYFGVSQPDPSGLRLSFAGLPPRQIIKGIEILGDLAHRALARSRDIPHFQTATAVV
jgi:2-aminoadipate transaminase